MPNKYPVILVHGIFGFGPYELGRRSYWGNAFNVISPLERYEASVGPISSAHDRACELAAQIKGTRVDYGAINQYNFWRHEWQHRNLFLRRKRAHRLSGEGDRGKSPPGFKGAYADNAIQSFSNR